MIETLTTPSNRSLEAACGKDRVHSRAGHLPADLPPGVVFQANVFDGSDEAEENWAEALGLAQNQIPLRLVAHESQCESRRLLTESVRKRLDRLTLQRVDPARSVLYNAGAPTSWNLDFYGRCRVGRTFFGTDRIPDGWAGRCNAMDEVWVPSEFNRETFTASGVDQRKIRVMHTGVDTRLFRPGLQPVDIPHARTINFLSVMCSQRRNGTDVLLRAYLQEFKRDEDVALILQISRSADSLTDPAAELLFFIETKLGIKIENAPAILLLDAPLSQIDSARLYASAQAFVLPSRGEAHGRSCLEALASGLPVIATRWGGTCEFLHDRNSFLVDIEGVVPASCEDEVIAGHRWAEPSVDHLRKLLREVSANSDDVGMRAERGRQDAVERWDWSVVIPQWVCEFRRLYG